MPIRLVVEIYHVALRIQLRRVCAVVPDRVDMRECLHAKFAVESTSQCIEDLVFLLCAMPYIPLMHITHCGIGGLQSITPWRTRVVRDVRALCGDNIRKQLEKNVSSTLSLPSTAKILTFS
jgi:hypothetical protein